MRKTALSIATLFAAAFALPGSMMDAFDFVPRMPRRRRWHQPHQGAHEMARRRGGKDWLDARNVSRARRGLPALSA